jgi:hypothetical protein
VTLREAARSSPSDHPSSSRAKREPPGEGEVRVTPRDDAVFIIQGPPTTNLGDWVIYKNLILMCQRYGRVLLGGASPAELLRYLSAQGDLSPCERIRWPVLALVRARARSARRVFVMAPPSHRFSWRREHRLLAFTRDLGRAYAYRLLGARHCILGVTFGPFDATETIFQRLGAPAVDTIGVRDEQSGALASSLGYRNVRAMPDFAFAEPIAARAVPLSTRPRDLVLSFRSPVVSGDRDDLSPDIRRLMGELLGAGRDRGRLSFVAQATADTELNQDLWRAFGERTGGDLTCFEGTARSVAPILARYSRAHVVLTNRLHVFLLALKQGAVPYIVTRVNRHHKISAMFKALRLEEFLLDLSARSDIHAVTQLDDAALDRRRQRLVETADGQREALDRAFDAVVGPGVER